MMNETQSMLLVFKQVLSEGKTWLVTKFKMSSHKKTEQFLMRKTAILFSKLEVNFSQKENI